MRPEALWRGEAYKPLTSIVSRLSSLLRQFPGQRPGGKSRRGRKGKIMRKVTILAGFVALFAAAGVAQGAGAGRSCIGRAEGDVLTVDALLTSMIKHGYRIRGLDTSGGCAKFRAVDRNGAEELLYVDLSSGSKAGARAVTP
jgi:hypothetical protein